MSNLFELGFVIFIFYLLYKLVFDFIVPVSKTTTQFKSKMQDMHKMQQDFTKQQKGNNNQAPPSPKAPSHESDYIDFEEVK